MAIMSDQQLWVEMIEKAIVRIPGTRRSQDVLPFGHSRDKMQLEIAFTASVWAYRCALILANAGNEIPWGIEENSDLLPDTNPAVFLIDSADDRTNFSDVYRDTILDKKIYGEAFWLMIFVGTILIRYARLPAAQTRPIYRSGRLSHFEFNNGFELINYSIEEVVHFREYGSLAEPVTPMQVAMDKIQIDQNMDTTNVSFFGNYAIPTYAWVADQHMYDKDLERYSSWWNKLLRNGIKRWRAAFMGGGFKPFRLQSPVSELALKDLREDMGIHISAAFGVPPNLVGALETANRSTWEQMQVSMHHNVVIPDSRVDAGVINAQMVVHLPTNGKFKFLTSRIEVLREERNSKSKRIMEQWSGGLIDHSTALSELDYSQDQAGPGLVAGSRTPGGDSATILKEVEKAFSKAQRMKAEGRILDFEYVSGVLSEHIVNQIRELV